MFTCVHLCRLLLAAELRIGASGAWTLGPVVFVSPTTRSFRTVVASPELDGSLTVMIGGLRNTA